MTFKPLPPLEIKASDIAYNIYRCAKHSAISNIIYDKPVPTEKVQELFRDYIGVLKIEQARRQEEDDKEDIRQKQISNFIISR